MELNFDPEVFHMNYLKTHRPSLSFDEKADYFEWKKRVAEKFADVIRLPEKVIEPVARIEYEKKVDDHTEIRFTFESEPGYNVPCTLLVPDKAKKPCPLMICVAGHSTGVHVYMGVKKYPEDAEPGSERSKNISRGLTALEYGYAALLIEQRSFGECHGMESRLGRCHQNAMQAILLGRTMIGERAFDISRAIDTLGMFKDILDLDRIALSGGSGGGTATYYASCVEPRIAASFPACAFSPLESSIFSLVHCQCNYMPDMLKYFEMQDLACLIAPRPLIIYGGEKDHGFLYEPAMEAYKSTVEKIYAAEGAPENCRFVHCDCGHEFRPAPAFDAFAEVTGWK